MKARSKNRRRVLILIAALVFLVGGAAALYAYRAHRTRIYFLGLRESGIAAYKEGKFLDAQVNLSRYLRREEFSHDADVLYLVADLTRQLHESDGAERLRATSLLKRAVELRPERDDWRRQLLEQYQELGFSSEMLASADVLLRKDPRDLQALRAKGIAQAALRMPAEALQTARACLNLDKHDLRSHLLVLQLYREPRNLGEAQNDPINVGIIPREDISARETIVRRAAQLLRDNPNDGRFELIMSVAYTMAGDLTPQQRDELNDLVKLYGGTLPPGDGNAGAVFFATRAAGREPPDIIYSQTLIQQLELLRLPTEALDVVKRSTRFNDHWIRRYLVRRLFESERYPEIEERIAGMRLSAASTADLELIAMRAIAAIRAGRKDQALPLIEEIEARRENKVAAAWATVIREFFLNAKANEFQVIDAVRTALSRANEQPYLRYFLAEAFLAQGETDLAIDSYMQAALRRPLWPAPLIRLSRLRLDTGDKSQALSAALAAQRVMPTLLSAINLAVVWSGSINESEWASSNDLLKLVEQIQLVEPGEEQSLPIYVMLLGKTGQREQAERVVRAALDRAKPASESTLIKLAAASSELKLGLEGDFVALAQKTYGMTPSVAHTRAVELSRAGKRQEAESIFEAARKGKTPEQDISWRLAFLRYLEQTNDPRAAAEWIAFGTDPNYLKHLGVQRAALAARPVQANKQFLNQTVERIRGLTGEYGASWRIARARLLIQDPANDPGFTQSIALLNEVVGLSPYDVEARVLLASALAQTDKLNDAVTHARFALGVAPDAAQVRLLMAQLCQMQFDFEQARQHLDLVDLSRLNPPQQLRTATLFVEQGDTAAALRTLERQAPERQDLQTAIVIAELYQRTGASARAEAVYAHLLSRRELSSAERASVIARWADFLASSGRAGDAEAALASLQSLELPPGDRELALAGYYANHASADQAIAQFRLAISSRPDHENAWIALITQQIRSLKFADALESAEQAGRALPASKRIATFRQNAPTIQGLPKNAGFVPIVAALLQGPADAATAAEALRTVTDGMRNRRQPEHLIADLRALSERSPRFVPLLTLLVQEYEAIGQRRAAADLAQRTTKLFPGSVEWAETTARALAAIGDHQLALNFAQRWRQLRSQSPRSADLFIAQMQITLNQAKAALAVLEPYAAELQAPQPDREFVALYTAALMNSGQHDKAATVLWPLVEKAPQWRQLWLQRALMASRTPTIATAWLERITPIIAATSPEEQSGLAGAWYELGVATRDVKYRDKSKQLLLDLVERTPTLPNAFYSLGMIYEHEENKASAEQAYRRTLELDPKHGIAMNNLAMILARRGEKLDEALAFAKGAVAAYPHLATIHDTLAFVQAAAKDYPSAIATLETAVQLEPNSPEWRIRLAVVCDQANQKDRAAKILREVESSLPDNARLRPEVRSLLEKLRASLDPRTVSSNSP